MPRKPFGVYMLVSGTPWMFARERTLADALLVARTMMLDYERPLIPMHACWIAAPPVVGRGGGATRASHRAVST
jgi:hypothetical protein